MTRSIRSLDNSPAAEFGVLLLRRLLVAILALVSWSMCAWSQSVNPADAGSNAPATQSSAPDPNSDPLVRDGLYVLQKGDEITIKVFGLPDLSETLSVRPDGKISVLLLPDTQAAGLTTKDLESRLTEAYVHFYREPKVSVIVRGFANSKVFIGGEVGNPGVMPLVGEMTVLSAVLQAGGFRPTAKMDSVILVRNNGHNAAVSQRVDVAEVLKKGHTDIQLRPFDVVYVPRSRIAQLDKFTDQYIRQLLPITLSGGFNYLFGTTNVVGAQPGAQ